MVDRSKYWRRYNNCGIVNMSVASIEILSLDRVASQVPIYEKIEIGDIITTRLVNFDDLYTYVKTLGQGASGVVKCYRENSTSNLFAMKEMNIFNSTELEILCSEVEILQEISASITSQSIVKYHDSFVRMSELGALFVIVTEHIEGASLQDYLNGMMKSGEYIEMGTIYRIAYWLFSILAVLHSKGYVHRDIKPNNIMVDSINDRFVLIDFGLTCSLNSKTTKTISCKAGQFDGTTIFMAPESWTPIQDTHKRFLPRNGNKLERLKLLDIWAAGITIYFLTENKPPWTEKFSVGVIGQITGDYEIQYTRAKEIKDILDLSLQKNPQERVNAEYIRDYIGHVISNRFPNFINTN